VAFRAHGRAFFLYGFAKNDRSNISGEEQEALEDYGSLLLRLDDQGIKQLINEGKLKEVQEEE